MSAALKPLVLLLAVAWAAAPPSSAGSSDGFDHGYTAYARVLARHVRPPRVDYAALQGDRGVLDRAVAEFDAPAASGEPSWTREERMAFWINAYNAFTLRVIIDHYPIKSAWFTLQPRNSIRQIDGVWTDITWRAAGREVTLDDIEHRILRPTFEDARVHFALNCASISCPPLAAEPYRAPTLDARLDAAARAYLASDEGLQVKDDRLLVSSIFDWYGDDFIAQYASQAAGDGDAKTRAIRGTIAAFGPDEAAARARTAAPRIGFLDYNWSLNDLR